MPFQFTFSQVLLVLIVTSIVFWLSAELRQLQRRKNQKELFIEKLRTAWLAKAVAFTEWRAQDGNRFRNLEHPHYQWHLQQEAWAYDRFLRIKRNESRPELNYLKYLQIQIRDNISIEEPPEN